MTVEAFKKKYANFLTSYASDEFIRELNAVMIGCDEPKQEAKDFNYFRCPDCGWVTELSATGLYECEHCNESNKQSLKYKFDHAVKHVIQRFYENKGWTKVNAETINHNSGNTNMRFEIRLCNHVPPRTFTQQEVLDAIEKAHRNWSPDTTWDKDIKKHLSL